MKHKILLIDSDKDFSDSALEVLARLGYKTFYSSDYESGFTSAKNQLPDIIIINLSMIFAKKNGGAFKSIMQDCTIKGIPVMIMLPPGFDNVYPPGIQEVVDRLPVKSLIEKNNVIQAITQQIAFFIEQGGETHRKIVKDISDLVEKWKERQGNLIMILHEIQNNHGYVPRSASFVLSDLLGVPLARIYEVLTFYNYFRVKTPGKHIISVCTGTACYLKGAEQIVEEISDLLNIEEGGTSADGMFQLETVRCLGCCGLAPVMTIDGRVYGHVDRKQIAEILAEHTKKGELQNA